jgi:tetratricopeptide (TPR) repeat protein
MGGIMSYFRALSFTLIVFSVSFLAIGERAWAAGYSYVGETKPGALLKKSYDQMIDGDFRDAVDTQILAVKADRNSVNARRYLSYSLLKIGASAEAIEQLHNLLAMTKATPIDMCMCGEACFQSGRLRQSELWFKEALAVDPQLESARVGLANIAIKRKHRISPVKAVVNVEEEVSEEPKTTYEMGQLKPEEGMVSYSLRTSRGRDTQSYASETVRMLRNSTVNQQVAAAQSNTTNGTAPNLGNNQVMNAWASYKGIQRR